DEQAVLEVLRAGRMSGSEVTEKFTAAFADWIGRRHAIAYPNGTESLRSAMWACGLAAGDEIICPTMTYWASCLPALTLGCSVHFADIERDTLCIDPADIEHRIGPRTRALVIVHYAGYPCDMDRIMPIVQRHNLMLIEDISHAHGGYYKGRKVGTFGHVAGMSMMSGKSFSIGEGGMAVMDDRVIYERCLAYGHYERTGAPTRWTAKKSDITIDELLPYRGLPLGGYKHRLNQTCSAMGLVQLKYFDARITEYQRARNRFWDLLEGVPGIRAHRVPSGEGSSMGGWYTPRGIYRAEELGGLTCARYCEAVQAEFPDGFKISPGTNFPLHLHPVFHTADIFRQGQPTVLAFGQRDVRQGPGSLPVAENTDDTVFSVPAFKHDRPEVIAEYAAAYRKVSENYRELL
ncbi:MAG: DegT/DnrJ/EryC1/StrS family aminotransferase, partial [Lentisphaerae bacterium]|nr:DegT/DnrJ/EryC1/StrS family aminotransferase [Lentisphaerota bacterium]